MELTTLSTESSYIIELKDVNFQICSQRILTDIDLKIKFGEIKFITGYSGAGKSSLLKIIAGKKIPYRGIAKRNFLTSQMMYLPQFNNLVEKKTIKDHLDLSYNPFCYGSFDEFNVSLEEISRVIGIYDELSKKIMFANGGLKQKVNIAMALLSRARVYLLDEPTCSLDIENTKKIFEIFELLKLKHGASIIWATHQRDLAKKFNGGNIHLDRGRIIYQGAACYI